MDSSSRANNRTLILGIDAGGSKTVATIARIAQSGQPEILGDGHSGPGNPLSSGLDGATHSIGDAILRCREASAIGDEPIAAAVIAVAGAANSESATAITEWASSQDVANRCKVVTDAHALLAMSDDPHQPAMGLVAGTGSIAVARDAQGVFHRAGGHGFLLGDEGSGYDIGRQALQAALQGEASEALVQTLLSHLQVDAIGQIPARVHRDDSPRTCIAGLAARVVGLAEQGDAASKVIAESAAWNLALLVQSVATSAAVATPAPLIFAGGVLLNSPMIRGRALEHVEGLGVPVKETIAAHDPSIGALRLAAQLCASR